MRRLGLLSAQGDRHEGVFRTLDRYDDHVRRSDRDNGSSEFGGCELPRLLWRKLVSARRNQKGRHMSGKFNPYDFNAFLQTIIVFVFLLGLLVAASATEVYGIYV